MKYLEITIQNRKIYACHVYGNKLRLFADNAETRHRTQTERVYEFRKNGKFEDLFFPLLSEAREFFQCSEIWAIPSSKAETLNRLQAKFGQQIHRVKDGDKRKYNHAGVLDLSGVEVAGEPSGKKIMLIDDVVTSGGTMIAVAEMLEAKGAAVVCMALGLNVKLFPEPPDVLEIEAEIAHRLGRRSSGEKAQSTLPAELVAKWSESFQKFKQEKMQCQV